MKETLYIFVGLVLGVLICVGGATPYVKNKDGKMIPDKYNTGPNPNLNITKVVGSEPGTTFNVSYITFYRGYDKDANHSKTYYGSNHLLLDYFNFRNAPHEITIERYDFSDFVIEFLDNHHIEGERKIIFKDCKFDSFNGARIHNKNLTFEFYDCEFVSSHGSYMKFERCVWHPTNGDAMDIFSDIEVKDSYIFIMGYYNTGTHLDGFQTFGKKDIDIDKIHFDNVRIELPKIKARNRTDESKWVYPYVNAPVMVAVEWSAYAHDVILENMHINGGGYSMYWGCSKDCQVLINSVARNIQVGYGHMFGIMYPKHGNMDNTTNIFDKVQHVTTPYIGSAWRTSSGVHVSVTNELLTERTMVCIVDGKNSTHTIPAHPKLTQRMEAEDVPEFDDLPYDMDIIVSEETDALEVSCYDVTDTGDISTAPLIATLNLVEIEAAVSFSVSALLVVASILVALL